MGKSRQNVEVEEEESLRTAELYLATYSAAAGGCCYLHR